MKIHLIVFFILLSLLPLSNVKAAEITCYSSVFAPYSYIDKGKPAGIDIDLITSIAKRINISVSFEIIPWNRLIKRMLVGEIDCAAAFLQSSTYAEKMSYMKTPITTGDYTLFIEKENKQLLENLSDFYGFTIAVNRGFKVPLVLNTAFSEQLIKKYEVGNELQSLLMLSTSRVHGVLTDKRVGLFNLEKLKINNVIPINKPLISTPVYLVFSTKLKDSGLVEKFDDALNDMKQDGAYRRILNKHLAN
jgi:polar amino acid transport system substrate-binding protein